MSQVSGIIQEVTSRAVSGGKTAYNITVGGQSYGVGLYPPKAKEGDYVRFTVDESRGYKNVERGTLQVSKNKPPAEAVAEAEATKPKAPGHDAKQDTISRQSAHNTAIDYLTLAQAAGILPAAPKNKGSGLEYLDTLLVKYTQWFYERNTGIAWEDISPSAKEEGSTTDGAAEPTDEGFTAPEDDAWA